jgi:fermentation-respiration switch protein FrsA (DUF1100 family)
MNWPLKLLFVLACLYAAIAALAWAFQDRMLFPTGMIPAAGPLPAGAERLALDTADGNRIQGVHIPPSGPAGPVVIGFGGNATNAEAVASMLHHLYPDVDVLAFHYRGYAPSTGAPGAAAMTADAPLVYDLAASRFPGRPIVAAGFSIGSGVAASLARSRRLDGLILVTPFDSLEKVAAGHYPWLPVGLLFRHRLPSADWLRASKIPVAMIAAERDTLVPPARTEALRRAVLNLVYDRIVGRVGHNDIYMSPVFETAMTEAMAHIEAASRWDA